MSKSKKPRSAAQKAATRKMLAANKARKSGASKRRSSKSGASTGALEGRVSNLERRVSQHSTRLGRVENTVAGVTGYLMDTIAAGVLPPVKSR